MLTGGILAIHVIVLTAFLLWKKANPAITLLLMGILMLFFAYLLNINGERLNYNSGIVGSIFGYAQYVFKSRLAETGLLIMLFGGYIEYMKRIHASDALIYLMMFPMSVFKNFSHISSIIIIPIGVLIYFAVPSATAMGLLLMATIYPILLGLGMSKTSSLAIISACTIFDVGMASVNSNTAAQLLDMNIMDYFSKQLQVIIPLVVVLITAVYFVNKYFDSKQQNDNQIRPYMVKIEEWKNKAPYYYAIFPLLPIIILLIYPGETGVLNNVSIAIIISFLIAGMVDAIRQKSLVNGSKLMGSFWVGFGRSCMSVVALMICADIFSQGLVKMGFTDFMVMLISNISAGRFISIILFGIMTFISVMVVGSGVSFFTAISPLLLDISTNLGISTFTLTMTMQLIAGFARTASPIAIVVITISELAGVSPLELAKRNIIPMLTVSLVLILITFFFY